METTLLAISNSSSSRSRFGTVVRLCWENKKEGGPSPSQCESTATIAIVVDPVNDPPRAVVANQSYTVHKGIYEESYALKEDETRTIQLHGIDKSGRNRMIGYFLDAVPEETKGRLLEDSMHEILEKSAILKYHNEYRYDMADEISEHRRLTNLGRPDGHGGLIFIGPRFQFKIIELGRNYVNKSF